MTEEAKYRKWMLEDRNVVNPCPACGGSGWKSYADTSTWHHDAGGQMLTSDVCDKCWGSGDVDNPWVNWKITNFTIKGLRTENEQLKAENEYLRSKITRLEGE